MKTRGLVNGREIEGIADELVDIVAGHFNLRVDSSGLNGVIEHATFLNEAFPSSKVRSKLISWKTLINRVNTEKKLTEQILGFHFILCRAIPIELRLKLEQAFGKMLGSVDRRIE